ncbi:hypothetical protein D3C73_1320480 [compost metagenome]
MVNGPGQKASAKARARASNTAIASASSALATWAIRGLKRGLPLASKIRATAWGLEASAASP